MADNNQASSISIMSNPATTAPNSLIAINATAQLPLKLTPTNYLTWRAQFNALLIGYDLMQYVDGTYPEPPKTVNDLVNPNHNLWLRQDQLLLHSIIASVSEHIMPLIASTTTSRMAWEKLKTLYANRSRSRVMSLKERLTATTQKGELCPLQSQLMLRIELDNINTRSTILTDSHHTTVATSPFPAPTMAIKALHNLPENVQALATGASANFSTPPQWLVDTAASNHVTDDLHNLSLTSPYEGSDAIVIGDGTGLNISHTGNTTLSTPSTTFTLSNVLCVPSIKKNLISVSQFCKTNHTSIEFFPAFFLVKDLRTGVPLARGQNKHDIYEWPSTLPPSNFLHALKTWSSFLTYPSSPSYLSVSLLHGHLYNCDSCLCNKSQQLPFYVSTLKSRGPLDLIYTDVWGPAPISSSKGFRFYVIFVDHFTKYIWFYPLSHKSDVLTIFPKFKVTVENYFKKSIVSIYSDNGGEFIALKNYLANNGISHLTTPPHTPQHNGTAERRHRQITTTGLTLLHQASLPLSFWPYAFQTAITIINRLPTPILQLRSPFQSLFGDSPNYLKLRVFGCLCYPWLRPYVKHKLESRSRQCVFLGYSLTQSAYHCLDLHTNRVFVSRHVRFVETEFPYSSISKSAQPPAQPVPHIPHLSVIQSLSQTPSIPTSSNIPSSTPPVLLPTISSTTNSQSAIHSCTPPPPCEAASTDENSPSLPPVPSPPPLPLPPPISTHPMITRAKNNIFKPRQLHTTTKHPLPNTLAPTCVSQALRHSEWRAAMSNEFNALTHNGTWTLVPPSPQHNLVGCKWVFRIKRKPDGSIDRYKARLVAKGFHQRPGLDYTETFSPVIKPTTIRIVICLALQQNWFIHQLDVNNLLFAGSRVEDVFMAQPQGFIDEHLPHHVCHLRKAIYGLKQAPRAWYTELATFLLSQKFVNSKADTSLFIYNSGGIIAYFLVYVDDLILTGNSNCFLASFTEALSSRFSVKNLGALHYFLGVEVVSNFAGVFLSQQKYIHDILIRTNMAEAKSVTTPLSTTTSLTLHDGSASFDASQFRSIVGSLQYLSLTRPDIAFTVNKLSQFMHKPTEFHWQAVKRLLRYLKGTITHGLFLTRSASASLSAFSDSDWAGNPDDRTSTSAYILFLGGNAIAWASRKQRSVARSSTEAEYRAIAATAAELAWVQNLLSELGASPPSPPVIYCDNVGATYLCANPVFHSRMKHIAIDFHFVRDYVTKGLLRVSHVSTTDQLADALTKPLSRQRFHSNGYMSPEYVVFGNFSVKSDVFSFGVMLLEIVSGKKNNRFYQQNPPLTLIGYVWELWGQEKALEIVDTSLKELYHPREALKCIRIGLLCVEEDAMNRPSMLAVVFMLSNETEIPSPNKPAFLFRESHNNPDIALAVEDGLCSINEVTISEIASR
uniref:Integrase catalytic domain-containing protein n=1 Tax=Salix viminalis TaxID=40686 RepID=A0A6N2KS64_SALVM